MNYHICTARVFVLLCSIVCSTGRLEFLAMPLVNVGPNHSASFQHFEATGRIEFTQSIIRSLVEPNTKNHHFGVESTQAIKPLMKSSDEESDQRSDQKEKGFFHYRTFLVAGVVRSFCLTFTGTLLRT